jgi:hypothetical protein
MDDIAIETARDRNARNGMRIEAENGRDGGQVDRTAPLRPCLDRLDSLGSSSLLFLFFPVATTTGNGQPRNRQTPCQEAAPG